MAIDRKMQIKINKQIKDKFEAVYLDYFGNKESLDKRIDEIINEIEEEMLSDYEINEEIYKKLRNRINKTKERWFLKEVNEKSSLYKEVNVIASGLYELGKDKFKIVYNVENLKELREKRENELRDWANTDDSSIVEFMYLKDKMPYQVKLAIQNDLKYSISSIIKNYHKEPKRKPITKIPRVLSEFPIDATNRATLKFEKVKSLDGSMELFANRYKIDGNLSFNTLIEVNAFKSSFIKGTIGALNASDLDLFLYLLSIADEYFYSTREIVTPIINIVRSVYKNNIGSIHYDLIRESLLKLRHMSSEIIDPSNKIISFNIIDNLEIFDLKTPNISSSSDKDGLERISQSKQTTEMVRVVVNIDIVKQLVENSTINMYSDIYNNFKSNYAKILVVNLQLERIALASEKGLFIKELGMSFFRRVLFFSDKKKYRHIKAVEEALDEMVKSKVVVKSFSRVRDIFTLEFIPISEEERKELIIPIL